MMTAWSRFPLGGVEAEARRREKEKQEGDQETELGGGEAGDKTQKRLPFHAQL